MSVVPHKKKHPEKLIGGVLWYLIQLSIIFQLYLGNQRKPSTCSK
jgi:hypothetical protein